MRKRSNLALIPPFGTFAFVPLHSPLQRPKSADLETPRLCEARLQPEHTTHAETIPEPDPSEITCHRRLGQAVILQAIEDRATHWFSSSYSKQSFEFWCAVGGLDPGAVKRKALEGMKETGTVMAAKRAGCWASDVSPDTKSPGCPV